MKKFLLSWLKLAGWYFGILLVLYVAALVVVWLGLRPIQHIEGEYFTRRLAADGPLMPNEYVEKLDYLSIKERADELMRAYNRRAHIIEIVGKRLRMLRRLGKVSRSVEKIVERNLDMMEKDNAQIRKQYERIVNFAQEQYAANFVKSHSPDMEEKARLFDKENQKLLRAVELPMSFR